MQSPSLATPGRRSWRTHPRRPGGSIVREVPARPRPGSQLQSNICDLCHDEVERLVRHKGRRGVIRMATTASARAKRDVRSMIERLTAWYWLALHTAVVQRAKGACGDSPRRLPATRDSTIRPVPRYRPRRLKERRAILCGTQRSARVAPRTCSCRPAGRGRCGVFEHGLPKLDSSDVRRRTVWVVWNGDLARPAVLLPDRR